MDVKHNNMNGTKTLWLVGAIMVALWQCRAQQAPLLWQITAPQSGATSYIFGTYHLVGSDYLKDHPLVARAYSNASTVVVETILDSTAMITVALKGMMREHSLQDLVDSADYVLLEQELEAVLGMPVEQLSNFKPIMVSTMYSLAKAQEATPQNFKYGGMPIDLYFADNGQQHQKKVVPLETALEQAEILFDSQTLEEQAAALVENVKAEVEDDLSSEILEAYMAEDLNRLWELNKDWDESMGEMTILLDERNKKWMTHLIPLLDEGEVFIAVGALHLPGPVGVLQLLRDKGYNVRPVLE